MGLAHNWLCPMGWLTVSLFLGLFLWTLRSIMHLDCISFNLARSAMNEINIAWIRMWSETEGLIICAYWGPISICNSIGAEVMAVIIGFEEFQKLKAFRSIAEGDSSAAHRHTPFFLSLTFHSVFSCSIFFWNLSLQLLIIAILFLSTLFYLFQVSTVNASAKMHNWSSSRKNRKKKKNREKLYST